MKDELRQFLGLIRLPGRLTQEQTALVLGFNTHDIPVLIRAKLVKPLGAPSQQATKYFAAKEIEALAAQPDWLHRATKALYSFWATQNNARAPRAKSPMNLHGGSVSSRVRTTVNQID